MRLIATAASGQATIFTLEHSAAGSWSIAQQQATAEGSARPVPGGSFVLDAKSGARCLADRTGLAAVLRGDAGSDTEKKCFWVSAGAKGVRTALNVNGERIAKVDWGSKVGTVQHVEVVGRLGTSKPSAVL